MFKAQAVQGRVQFSTTDDAVSCIMERAEAADVMGELASAILNAGDFSDPEVQAAVEAVSRLRKYLRS